MAFSRPEPTSVTQYDPNSIDVFYYHSNTDAFDRNAGSPLYPGSHYHNIVSTSWVRAVNIVSTARGQLAVKHYILEYFRGKYPDSVEWHGPNPNTRHIEELAEFFVSKLQCEKPRLVVIHRPPLNHAGVAAFHIRQSWGYGRSTGNFSLAEQSIYINDDLLDHIPVNVDTQFKYNRYINACFRLIHTLVHETYHVLTSALGLGCENTPARLGFERGEVAPRHDRGEAGQFGERCIFGGGLTWQGSPTDDPEGGGLPYPYLLEGHAMACRITFDSMQRIVRGFILQSQLDYLMQIGSERIIPTLVNGRPTCIKPPEQLVLCSTKSHFQHPDTNWTTNQSVVPVPGWAPTVPQPQPQPQTHQVYVHPQMIHFQPRIHVQPQVQPEAQPKAQLQVQTRSQFRAQAEDEPRSKRRKRSRSEPQRKPKGQPVVYVQHVVPKKAKSKLRRSTRDSDRMDLG